MRMRAFPGAAVAVAASITTVPAAMAAPAAEKTCVRSHLATPAGASNLMLTGSERTGRYQIGVFDDDTGARHLLRWRDGVPADLGALPEGYGAGLVSPTGEIVGSKHGTDQFVWRLKNGVRTTLPNPPTAETDSDLTPLAVNTRGEIVGLFWVNIEHPSQAIKWGADNGVQFLPVPAGYTHSRAEDIDEDGTVVGSVGIDGSGNASKAIMWSPDGTWKLLGPEGAPTSTANAIRDGVVTGEIGEAVVKWTRSGTIETLDENSFGVDVSARGSVVGGRRFLNGTVDYVVWKRSGAVWNLPATGTDPGIYADGIDDSDNVYGWDRGADALAVRWTCR